MFCDFALQGFPVSRACASGQVCWTTQAFACRGFVFVRGFVHFLSSGAIFDTLLRDSYPVSGTHFRIMFFKNDGVTPNAVAQQ